MQSETKQIALVAVLLLLVVVIISIASIGTDNPQVSQDNNFKNFKTIDEIKKFVQENYNEGSSEYYYGGIGGGRMATDTMMVADEASAGSSTKAEGAPAPVVNEVASDYSQTNIQVKGVDEPDVVKNDDQYIYTLTNNKVIILDAYPAEQMKILSQIDFDNQEYASDILLNKNQLIVFTSKYDYIQTGFGCDKFANGYDLVRIAPIPCGGYSKTISHAYVYDISDRTNPKLKTDLEIDGGIVESRMIDSFVYIITTKDIQLNAFSLPSYSINGELFETSPEKVSYYHAPAQRYIFNSVTALNLDDGETNSQTFLTDYSTNLYVSENNIYLTTQKSIEPKVYLDRLVKEVYIPTVPQLKDKLEEILNSDDKYNIKAQKVEIELRGYFENLDQKEIVELGTEFEKNSEEFSKQISKELEKTVVHKIAIDGLKIEYKTFGEVPGNTLNQFSMDEYDGTFRIATTTGNWRTESANNLYILDENLKITGSVEDLAKGERIYSTRFLGNKAYMVTFRQTDPLFVIDTSNPENPQVLGYLKVTGFSSYLHPYDENHLIGIGQEASTQGRTQGVKVSLFDISDFQNPKEMSKYVLTDGSWSYSEALNDHKAFLFDKEKELIVIPMSYTLQIKSPTNGRYDYENWQGVYVLNINLLDGITLKGKISHDLENTQDYYQSQGYIKRSLYMNNNIYTVSDQLVKANLISDLSEVKKVNLPYEYNYPIAYGIDDVEVSAPEMMG